MANLLLELIQLLSEHDLVAGDGIDSFRDKMPDSPSEVICLVEYPGTPIAHTSLAVRNIQISVRMDSYKRSREKAYQLFNFLHKSEEPIFDTDTRGRWFTGKARQTPFKLKEDTQGRIIFAFNYSVTTFND